MTQVFRVDPDNFLPEELDEAARILEGGGLVAFPTETVYGIAASSDKPESIHHLQELQGRGNEDPYSLHIASVEDLPRVVAEVPPLARALVDLYWPGPLTLIFPGSAGQGTGVRLPSHPVAKALIERVGKPLVAPSANVAGEPAATHAADVLRMFDDSIDAVIDSGPAVLGEPSTVVRLEGDDMVVLREGIITEQMMRRALDGRRIIFVCTGNSCRSPMAEALFKSMLAERLECSIRELPDRGYRISSAGVHAFAGGRASSHAIELMRERGIDLENHSTRGLTRELAAEADQIIALSPSHQWQIVQWDPELEAKIDVISETGVSDPIGGDIETYRQCAREIEAALRNRWADKILGAPKS